MSLDQRFADAMGQLLGPDFPSDIGLAVSGGGDSMAMLYLAHNWAHRWGVRLHVCTVDHGLRAESAEEAAMVAEECAALGWPHATLHWHWEGAGNKMDAARRGRLRLIDEWRGVLGHVLLAHTQDDLAETFLMRLARGSGVEGLSAMSARHKVRLGSGRASYEILRPCLEMTRAELRHYLKTLKGRWVEDPSNDDPAYERVRMRQALPALAELGLGLETLSETAKRQARAREALRARAAQVWQGIGQEGCVADVPTGDILFDRNGFEAVERDTQLRLLAAALCWVATAEYRPRAEPLEALLERMLSGGGGTLHGCEARMEKGQLRVFREYKAVSDVTVPHATHQFWDGRWQVFASAWHEAQGIEVRALGEEGWVQVQDKPDSCPPHQVARSLPALWQGDRLLACDALGFGPGHSTRLWPMGREMYGFKAFLMSH